jgi:tetratricopeptide (TPR) repeat protein
MTLINLARAHRDQGRHGDAEPALQRALAIYEKARSESHPDLAWTLNNLGIVYRNKGRYAEAEGLLKRALAAYESSQGSGHGNVAWALEELAINYRQQGRNVEAEPLAKRALAIYETNNSNRGIARTLNVLARIYGNVGRHQEADELLKRALAINEKMYGDDRASVGGNLANLARSYWNQRRYKEADPLLERSLAIYEKVRGENHPTVAWILNYLGTSYRDQGRYAEAEPLVRRSLAIYEQTLGPHHPDTAWTLGVLANLYDRSGDRAQALVIARKASAAVIAHAAEGPGARDDQTAGGLVERRAGYFHRHVYLLAADLREPKAEAAHEALEIAQWATQSSAAAAVHQMAARFAAGDGVLPSLVREKQDLIAAWRERDARLLEFVSSPDQGRDRAAIETLRRQIGETERALARVSGRLEKEFPDYTALAAPKPLAAAEVQKQLGDGEALVFWLPSGRETYVFALTREHFAWQKIALGSKDLGAKVAAFRRGLDLEELQRAITAGRQELFDLGFAHQLYGSLFGPIEAIVKDKPRLIVVPSGPLTGLPFHLLLTEKPAMASPEIKDIGVYRDASWLIKRCSAQAAPQHCNAARAAMPAPSLRLPDRGAAPASTRAGSWRHCRLCPTPRSSSRPSPASSAQRATSISAPPRTRPRSSARPSPTTASSTSRPMDSWPATWRSWASPRWRCRCPTSRASSTTASSPPARWRSSSSTPIGWCCRHATRRPATRSAARPCRASRARSSMRVPARCWCPTGPSTPAQPRGSPPRRSTS